MAQLIVQDIAINVVRIKEEDYICLTDMLKAKDGEFFITDWLRNRNTLEYIGIWEQFNNPHFNYGEFATIRNQAGLNSFKISVKEFVEKTNAMCIQAKAGRYGGTYAHKDIAFEFAMWISPQFKFYIVRDYQRLKAEEQKVLGWSMKRELAEKGNIRDYATINQLICLSNLENLNAVFINEELPQSERLLKLNQIAQHQMRVLEDVGNRKILTDRV